MEIKVSARHGHLADSTQEAIREKAAKLLRLFERLIEIELTVDLANQARPKVDLAVEAEHKHDFVASDESGDLMGSVDAVVHKMEQQLRKYKEKIQNHNRTPASGEH